MGPPGLWYNDRRNRAWRTEWKLENGLTTTRVDSTANWLFSVAVNGDAWTTSSLHCGGVNGSRRV